MPMPAFDSRVNVMDLRFVISEKVGPERAQQYFACLERFLSQKLGKLEFEKLCYAALGEENVPLHNQLIRAIIKNACQAKTPPLLMHGKDALKQIGVDGGLFRGYRTSAVGAWSNGDILPPHRSRFGVQDRKHRDRPSPLGLGGKRSSGLHRSSMDLGSKDCGQLEIMESPSKRRRMEKLSEGGDLSSMNSLSENKAAITDNVENGFPVEEAYFARPLLAPVGVLFRPPSLSNYCRCLTSGAESTSLGTNCCTGSDLCNNADLKRRMDDIAASQGLGGVSLDTASLLNFGLDSYLTRLIKSCVQLVGSGSGYELVRDPINKQMLHNGTWQGNHLQVSSRSGNLEGPSESNNQHLISLQDFKIAMQLNPQQLGGKWPFLLEKFCVRSYE